MDPCASDRDTFLFEDKLDTLQLNLRKRKPTEFGIAIPAKKLNTGSKKKNVARFFLFFTVSCSTNYLNRDDFKSLLHENLLYSFKSVILN